MNLKKDKKSNVLLETFDAIFIMLLCFGTLLTAMIITKDEIVVTNYSIDLIPFIITVMTVVLYLYFIISQSAKGLRVMIPELYDEENNKGNPESNIN
ncbi:hypothetical protein [Clostridium sp.]|jgi:hypothetical protein|uniref:hypothetical protein n=1 Tax=Clostridium sp. TaxID=1506 RepID=UPI003EF05EC9